MPAIKKKWMKASHEEGSNTIVDKEKQEDQARVDQRNDSGLVTVEEIAPKPVKRTMPTGPSMLKRLDGEVLHEKRKRFVPQAELKLSKWLDNNFEKRPDVSIKLTLMYKHYTELCQSAGSDILAVPEFNRMVKEKFGKTFGLQENSAYKTVLKERKITDKKSGGGFKMKEIVCEAFNHFGNPWLGVRFFTLKRYISSRYPALQLDQKPKILKRALQMGVNFGYVDLIKGVGMAGYYRLPGGEPPAEPKEKDKAKEKTPKAETTDDENKPPEGTDDNEAPKEEESEQVAKKKKLVKKPQSWSLSKISFSSPRLLEETFPLALAYQSAPKTASILRIRRYIQEKYGETVTDHRWRQTLESGIKKGYWEHISGSGIAGTLHLQMDDFNPSSNQLEDMVCAAIIACHEPKAASANQIKKYVTSYHSEFGIDQRPDKFKKALQRAVEKKMIMQLSGLGAAGSYQLMVPFTPSPAVLAGDDDESEEEEDYEPPTYVPRGTKSRGIPKLKTMEVVRSPQKKSKLGVLKRPAVSIKSGKAVKGKNSVMSPAKGKSKGAGRPRTQGKARVKVGSRKRAPSPLTDEEEDEGDQVEYTPRQSKSRGGSATSVGSQRGKNSIKEKNQSSSQTKTPKSKHQGKSTQKMKPPAAKRSHLSEDDLEEVDDEEDADAPEYTPRKSKSRGGGKEEIRSSGKVGGGKKKR